MIKSYNKILTVAQYLQGLRDAIDGTYNHEISKVALIVNSPMLFKGRYSDYYTVNLLAVKYRDAKGTIRCMKPLDLALDNKVFKLNVRRLKVNEKIGNTLNSCLKAKLEDAAPSWITLKVDLTKPKQYKNHTYYNIELSSLGNRDIPYDKLDYALPEELSDYECFFNDVTYDEIINDITVNPDRYHYE